MLMISVPISVKSHFSPVLFVLCLVRGAVATASIIFLAKRKG